MSISLNNHESRIKVLESKGFKLTKITSSPVFLNRSWKNICNLSGFKLMYFIFDTGYSGHIYTPDGTDLHFVISLEALKQAHIPNKICIQHSSSEVTLLKISDSNVLSGWSSQEGSNPTDNSIQVWGLNLYYKLRNLFKEVVSWLSL